ncbi:DinB family protein [Chitinophaga vietnamensis]|uniref:DinB family protein n=1 Tax=Chitinophaga vietnamensis TaxID=2593957 RepID=UPI00137557DB|nr:DinB family protein [Chitinophaga vietnamensis]
MKNSAYHSSLMFRMNERLFVNALDGVSEEQAQERISGHNNPLIWIAAHTVWARYNAAALLGQPVTNPYKDRFGKDNPYNPADTQPSLSEVKQEWKKASELLLQALEDVSEDHLSSTSPLPSPIGEMSTGGTLAFFAQHESYDIGQMAFLKKYHTERAMAY